MSSRSRRTEPPACSPNIENVVRWIVGTVALFSFTVMACAQGSSQSQPPERSLETLRSAAPSATIGDAQLRVEAVAWRSFQPIAGERGDPMLALVKLIAAAGATIASDLRLDAVYFIRGDEVVAAVASEEHPREGTPNVVETMVRNGPRWTPGDSIDVIASVRHGGAATILLRAPRIVLTRVD